MPEILNKDVFESRKTIDAALRWVRGEPPPKEESNTPPEVKKLDSESNEEYQKRKDTILSNWKLCHDLARSSEILKKCGM